MSFSTPWALLLRTSLCGATVTPVELLPDLLEHLKKLNLHLDAQPGDRLFWFTTTGWMMWNFLVGGLLTEASIVLYDGNPATPTLGRLWDLAADAGVTCFGTSAGYIAACQKAGVEPRSGRDLSRLDSVGSTGSPLAPEGFDWVRDRLGEGVQLEAAYMMGADYYQTLENMQADRVSGRPWIGVGEGTIIRRAIVDKNARIGANVRLLNEAGIEEAMAQINVNAGNVGSANLLYYSASISTNGWAASAEVTAVGAAGLKPPAEVMN